MISTAANDSTVIDSVKHWINAVIIGLNFCPFAKKDMERQTVHYFVSQTVQISPSLNELLEQLTYLEQQPEIQTALLIFQHGFGEFDEYLELVEYANGLIQQGGYSGIYQLATFHPNYCFADESADDPANYTNRSPYPILHILRESSVEQVLKHYPQPEQIPINNINKARQLGSAYIERLMKNNKTPTE